ncbi:Ig-like domain repeat protein [Streptomyces collinus]|uniref:Ig-like domain repeat protein n=1 Tax=Streptomyces collinus TaxID=42684 RepID=UPI0029423CB1|nr:Ig-like domain repeat protein [Streptomyces collinus]
MRTVTTATALAVLLSSAALAAAPAFADTSKVLPVHTTGDVVADGAHQKVFVSDPYNGKIVVTDYSGTVVKQLPSLPGVTGLELSADSNTLYAAVPKSGAIVAFDTVTGSQTARWSVGSAPTYLTVMDGRLWFGYGDAQSGGNIGSIDLTDPEHKVSLGLDTQTSWFCAPMLDGAQGVLVAGMPEQSPSEMAVYDASSGTLTRTAHGSVEGSGLKELAVTPDGKDVVVANSYPYYQGVYKTADLTADGQYPTNAYPDAVAVAPDGSVAAGIAGYNEPDVYVFKPGSHTSVREYDFPSTSTGGNADLLDAGALAWAPDGSRLFAVTSNEDGAHRLHVLDAPTKAATVVKVDAPTSAPRARKLTVKGKVTSKVALPAGTRLTVTRTDLDSPKGKSLPSVTAKADGTFSFTDTPPAGGKVKYTVASAGDAEHAAGSGSDSVAVSRAKPALTVDNNGKVYAYGKDVKFTAHLGTTYKNRTVEIWADPFGSDKPNKLVKSGKVNSSGNLSVTLDLKRDTKVTAKFAGDSRYQSRSATSTVGAKVSVSTSVSNHYKAKSAWGHTYYFFHKNKNPMFTTKMPYYPHRAQRFDFQVYYQGKWYPGDSQYFALGTDGRSRVQVTGNHAEDVGWRFRMRSDYINGSSGDTVNSTTYGSWKYFTYTG